MGIIGIEISIDGVSNVAGNLRFNSEKDILQIHDGNIWIEADTTSSRTEEIIDWLAKWKEERQCPY